MLRSNNNTWGFMQLTLFEITRSALVGIFQATESNITCSHLIGAGPRFMYMEVISKYILAYLLLCNSLFVYLCGSLHRRMNVPVGILASLFSKCYVKNLLQLLHYCTLHIGPLSGYRLKGCILYTTEMR